MADTSPESCRLWKLSVSAYSSCAGDEIYISLEELYKQGLLKVLPEAFRKNAAKVDYQAVREWKEPYLREACSNFQETEDYQRFVEQPG